MRRPGGNALRSVVLSLCVLVVAGLATASDPPDSGVNPKSGYVETVDSCLVGSQYKIRHTIATNGEHVTIAFEAGASDDVRPRLAISSGGDTWVAWWRDGSPDGVLIRKRTYSSGNWSGERVISRAGENGRNPSIVHDGTHPWVAYEASGPGETIVVVADITEDPVPVGLTDLATTSFTGDVDVQIRSESGHLWVTWIDSETNVGWCKYEYATGMWSVPGYESYANDSVGAARIRIRSGVVE